MIKQNRGVLGFTAVLAACSLLFESACAGGGARPRQEPGAVQGRVLSGIPSGAAVNVVLRDGSKVRARYLGTSEIAADLYTAKYNVAREKLKARTWLPAMDEPLVLSLDDGSKIACVFKGFDNARMAVIPEGTETVRRAELPRVRQISGARGETADPAVILGLGGDIPGLTSIRLKTGQGTIDVPQDEIERMTVRPQFSPILIVVLAAAVGAIAIAFAAGPHFSLGGIVH